MNTTTKPTKARYSILAAVFINVVINYMDRSNISVGASFISNELGLSTIQVGYLFSAFGLAYALSQIPGGYLADKLNIRYFYSFCLITWSIATILQGFVTSFIILLILRIFIGLFEAPSYPLNNRIITKWFPDNERAGAIATYTSGQFIGLAFLTPALISIEHYLGWRALFYITGAIGLLWGIIWMFIYRDPNNSSKINPAELEYITKGGALVEDPKESSKEGKVKFQWKNLKTVLTKRKLWGIYLGQFGLGATLMFFLTWFPKYLIDFKGMNFLQSGFTASIPFIFAFFGVLFSGFISDYMAKKNVSVDIARKTPVVTGLLLSTSIVGANYTNNPFWVTLFMSVAFFGNGLASITWVFVSLIAPKKLIGLTGGVFNFIGGLSAMIVPTAIGYLVSDGNFEPALIFISSLTLLAALSYIFLVGKVERIED
ncbi:MFS transporter [Wenyingzhuangia sp. IMCC45574]